MGLFRDAQDHRSGYFHTARDRLASRRPTRTPPRVVNSPTLLTGVAKCATCGGGMTIRTGKGGRYRYYSCNNRITKGASACPAAEHPNGAAGRDRRERARKSDRPARQDQGACLPVFIERQRNRGDEQAHRSKELRQQLRETETKIGRVLDAIQEGLAQETDLVRDRLAKLEQERDEVLPPDRIPRPAADCPGHAVIGEERQGLRACISGIA